MARPVCRQGGSSVGRCRPAKNSTPGQFKVIANGRPVTVAGAFWMCTATKHCFCCTFSTPSPSKVKILGRTPSLLGQTITCSQHIIGGCSANVLM